MLRKLDCRPLALSHDAANRQVLKGFQACLPLYVVVFELLRDVFSGRLLENLPASWVEILKVWEARKSLFSRAQVWQAKKRATWVIHTCNVVYTF